MKTMLSHLNLGIPDFIKVIFRKFFYPLLVLVVILLPGSVLQVLPEFRLSHASRALASHLTKVKETSIENQSSSAILTAFQGDHQKIAILNTCPESTNQSSWPEGTEIIYEGLIDKKYPEIGLQGKGLSKEVIESSIICYDMEKGFLFNADDTSEIFFLLLSDQRHPLLGENSKNILKLVSQITVDGRTGSIDFELL